MEKEVRIEGKKKPEKGRTNRKHEIKQYKGIKVYR